MPFYHKGDVRIRYETVSCDPVTRRTHPYWRGMATHHTTVPHYLERLNTIASGERRAGVYLQAWANTTPGRASEMDFGLAALHALVGVIMGAKPRNAPLSLSFSRRPQHSL